MGVVVGLAKCTYILGCVLLVYIQIPSTNSYTDHNEYTT